MAEPPPPSPAVLPSSETTPPLVRPQNQTLTNSPAEIQTESQTTEEVKIETPSTTLGACAAFVSPEMVSYTITMPSCSAWFSKDEIHETEKRILPEFFDGKSTSRNPNSYKYIRDSIIQQFRAKPVRKLTLTEARKTIVADVGSTRRVFDFLEEWGLINYAPSPKKPKDRREEELEAKAALERKEDNSNKRTCTGCLSVCSLACFTTDKADITLCARCFVRSNYQRPGLSSADFKRVDLTEDSSRSEWSDKEILHLLEAVSHYGEDWKKVAEYVASRSEKDCIARFLKLPFGEQFVEEGQNGNLDEKRRRLSPLADASNPIMAQVAFLSAIVGPRVSEAAARAAVASLSDYSDLKEDEEEDDSIKKAEMEIEKEQEDLERSLSEIVDVQMKEMKDKIERFEEMESLMEKEWLQVQNIRDSILVDQLALAQNQQKGRENKETVTWHKFRSIGDIIDKGTTLLL